MGTVVDGTSISRDIPFLNIVDQEFRYDAPEVVEAQERSWYADSPIGILVLRYAEARDLLRDPRLDHNGKRYLEMSGVTAGPIYDWFVPMIVNHDGEDHRRLRGLVNKAFTPRMIDGLRPFIRAKAEELTDRLASADVCEFVEDFGNPLPLAVMCELLGVPAEDYDTFRVWTTDVGLVWTRGGQAPAARRRRVRRGGRGCCLRAGRRPLGRARLPVLRPGESRTQKGKPMIVLIVAVVLLAVATVGHLLLTFALIRRVRDLQNRTVVPHDDGLPTAGTPVGPFSLERLDGSRLDTEDLATGDVLVGFFAAGCSPCTAVVADLLDDPPAERFVALVDSGAAEPTTDLATRLSSVAEVAVVPWESTVSAAFGQEGFPALLRVRDGVIVEASRARAGLSQLAVR
ncbi:cytochrome P450 [Actinophytocola algeriensis]|uniref:Cytochrome P450 n=1 Tax=Actinophytocola algeriensis TaxID=1768010 RepID=A0A7W7VK87_9PSEU|nr:cytochrome P450 [Actinophytocola algeriensis]MBB4912810.1 hypothetical protein [Actinophytocola algeriensis]MBE1474156.1 hypothetical protein [Actinophytocola algeriensis]